MVHNAWFKQTIKVKLRANIWALKGRTDGKANSAPLKEEAPSRISGNTKKEKSRIKIKYKFTVIF